MAAGEGKRDALRARMGKGKVATPEVREGDTLVEVAGGKYAILLRPDRASSRLRYGEDEGFPTNTEYALACEVAALREDAMRWRALMRCGRISMQGSAGVDPETGERRNGSNVHFGAEFWPEPLPQDYRDRNPESAASYDRQTKWGIACLRALADEIIAREAAGEANAD